MDLVSRMTLHILNISTNYTALYTSIGVKDVRLGAIISRNDTEYT